MPVTMWGQTKDGISPLKKGKVIPLQARCGPEGG